MLRESYFGILVKGMPYFSSMGQDPVNFTIELLYLSAIHGHDCIKPRYCFIHVNELSFFVNGLFTCHPGVRFEHLPSGDSDG